jgi:hypothetical protein
VASSIINNILAKKMKDYTTICSPNMSEILAVVAIRNRKKIFETNLQIIEKNVESLRQVCQKYEFLSYSGRLRIVNLFDLFTGYYGGSVCFIQFSHPKAGMIGHYLLSESYF